jgi:hypothetical protein
MRLIRSVKKYFLSTNRSRFVVFFLILISLDVTGQNVYHFFKYYEPFNPDSTGKFFLAVDNVNFFKNNEYKKEIARGYTLTGAWLRPKLVYYPDEKLRVEFGGHVLKFTGRDDYYHLSPWFNVHYKPTEKISVILGNLDADENHQLPEPVFEPELFYTAKPEAGIQTRYQSMHFTADLWIDWQQMIMKGDPYKERFVFGTRTNLVILDKNNGVLSFPFAFYGMHQGGEIDTAPGLAKSFLSLTPGLSFKKTLTDKMFRGWGLNTSFSLATYPKDSVIFQESNGWGFYATGTLDTRLGGLSLSYWHGHHFYTPQGGIVYQNYPGTGANRITDNELINLKYHYDYEIFRDTYFGFVFDYYYDTIRKQTMNSEGLYLIVNFSVLAKRPNRQ